MGVHEIIQSIVSLNIYGSWIIVLNQPMKLPIEMKFTSLRACIAAAWVFLCLIVIGAPVSASKACDALSSFMYFIFSRVCHQIPERSFAVAGFPLAVCHRCFGIYLGLAAGSLLVVPFRSPGIRRAWALAAAAPILIDIALPFAGFVGGNPAARFLTGLLFGIMLSSLFVRGIEELVDQSPWHRSYCKGGVK